MPASASPVKVHRHFIIISLRGQSDTLTNRWMLHHTKKIRESDAPMKALLAGPLQVLHRRLFSPKAEKRVFEKQFSNVKLLKWSRTLPSYLKAWQRTEYKKSIMLMWPGMKWREESVWARFECLKLTLKYVKYKMDIVIFIIRLHIAHFKETFRDMNQNFSPDEMLKNELLVFKTSAASSVTRLGDLLDFGQHLKVCGNN